MFINGIDIGNYEVEIMSKSIESPTFSTSKQWNKRAITPVIISKQFTYGTFNLTVLVYGSTEDLLIINKSNLINDISDSLIQDGKFYFRVTLTSIKENEPFLNEVNEKYCEMVTFKLDINEKYKDGITETLNDVLEKTINVIGNKETPAIVEITPTTALADITLEGLADDPIRIENLTANKTVILDGELQKVTVDGVNKYGDTDMWDFPRLKPGSNTIKVDKSNCDIKIKYKPRYI